MKRHTNPVDPRAAGMVTRYHTWPLVRKQQVNEHTWNALRILLTIAPDYCGYDVVAWGVVHDLGEYDAGDMPHSAKKANPVLAERLEEVESSARLKLLSKWEMRVPHPTHLELMLFKYSELLEMWEFGLEEIESGCVHGRGIRDNAMSAAEEIFGMLPESVQESARRYIARRLATHQKNMENENYA